MGAAGGCEFSRKMRLAEEYAREIALGWALTWVRNPPPVPVHFRATPRNILNEPHRARDSVFCPARSAARFSGSLRPAGKLGEALDMKQHLAVSAIGSDRTGMVHELTRVISECGGNISESRMANLGTEFAMLLLVSGNWHALAKLETELKRLAETNGLSVHLKRTEPRSPRTDMLPYSIDVVCLDQGGIVSGLSGFFSTRGIDIAEVSTRSYPAAHTGAPMFSVQMIVNVPSRIHVAHLREEFMEFCDSLNLDAILEPVKS
jgi:glycine cleavage system transcriptional repressor